MYFQASIKKTMSKTSTKENQSELFQNISKGKAAGIISFYTDES
jgi:hypothetical protein